MKIGLGVSLAALATTCVAVDIVWQTFPGWKPLVSQSRDIVVVQCNGIIEPPDDRTTNSDGLVLTPDPENRLSESRIQVIAVLKGGSRIGPGHLRSFYEPRLGEQYLLFGTQETNTYDFIEDYRMVALGSAFHSNLIAGKSLNEQIQTLLKYRMDELDREMDRLQRRADILQSHRRQLGEGFDDLAKP